MKTLPALALAAVAAIGGAFAWAHFHKKPPPDPVVAQELAAHPELVDSVTALLALGQDPDAMTAMAAQLDKYDLPKSAARLRARAAELRTAVPPFTPGVLS